MRVGALAARSGAAAPARADRVAALGGQRLRRGRPGRPGRGRAGAFRRARRLGDRPPPRRPATRRGAAAKEKRVTTEAPVQRAYDACATVTRTQARNFAYGM